MKLNCNCRFGAAVFALLKQNFNLVNSYLGSVDGYCVRYLRILWAIGGVVLLEALMRLRVNMPMIR